MLNPTQDAVTRKVADLLAEGGPEPDRLLQYLVALQGTFSQVPEAAIRALSPALGVTCSRIRAAVAFYAFLHAEPRGDFDILFSDNITDRLAGSEGLRDRLCQRLGVRLGQPRPDGRVTVDLTSDTGMGDQGPALLVNGLPVTRLTTERIGTIATLVEAASPLADWPPELFAVTDQIHRTDLLLGEPAPEGVGLARLRNLGAEADQIPRADLLKREPAPADAGLARLLNLGPDAALGEIERSGLRGRGGAGYPTALKWRVCREAPGDERYVICNADEGEPGTFKDRVLLSRYADPVFGGMTLCAGIIGSRRGYLYLRGEYRYLLPRLQAILAQRRARGLLGREILGQAGFDFDIEIHLGAGAYICGEESALIESLEGKRGIPRKRPPYPVVSGFHQRPTVVDNVETFLAAARILARGGDWFRGVGTKDSAGTKILSLSGDLARPGIYEYPFGTPVSQVLADAGGTHAQAVQVSGAAGITLAPSEFDRCLAFEDLPTAGAFIVLGPDRDLLEMNRAFARFFAHESCGFCTPCRVGGRLLEALVEKVAAGRASAYDLKEIRQIGGLMRQASHCGLGQTAPNHLLDVMDKFPAIFQRRLRDQADIPAFDLDAALAEARALTGRTDVQTHREEP